MFSVGSGSAFAYGILDSAFDYDLPAQEAIELARRAIYHAAHRDNFSGGNVHGTLYFIFLQYFYFLFFIFFFMKNVIDFLLKFSLSCKTRWMEI